jgi:hypothetical protein
MKTPLHLSAFLPALPDVSRHCGIRPISDHGNVNEIVGKCCRADHLRTAVNQLQSLLYAA